MTTRFVTTLWQSSFLKTDTLLKQDCFTRSISLANHNHCFETCVGLITLISVTFIKNCGAISIAITCIFIFCACVHIYIDLICKNIVYYWDTLRFL